MSSRLRQEVSVWVVDSIQWVDGQRPTMEEHWSYVYDIHLFIWKTIDVLILPLPLVLQSMNRVFQMSKNYQMIGQSITPFYGRDGDKLTKRQMAFAHLTWMMLGVVHHKSNRLFAENFGRIGWQWLDDNDIIYRLDWHNESAPVETYLRYLGMQFFVDNNVLQVETRRGAGGCYLGGRVSAFSDQLLANARAALNNAPWMNLTLRRLKRGPTRYQPGQATTRRWCLPEDSKRCIDNYALYSAGSIDCETHTHIFFGSTEWWVKACLCEEAAIWCFG